MKIVRAIFGAKAQVALGCICFLLGIAWWVYIEIRYHRELGQDPLVASIFRVSMFFGIVACYAIVATGLGYKATERVESVVTDQADIEHAENVEVEGG